MVHDEKHLHTDTFNRMGWMLAIFNHGDWPGYDYSKTSAIGSKKTRELISENEAVSKDHAEVDEIKKKCSNCRHFRAATHCGSMAVCDDWDYADPIPDHWPNTEDMHRSMQAMRWEISRE